MTKSIIFMLNQNLICAKYRIDVAPYIMRYQSYVGQTVKTFSPTWQWQTSYWNKADMRDDNNQMRPYRGTIQCLVAS